MCTGVIVSVAFFADALESALCEVACIVSYESLAERGLGSLPGGDESELVKGVRACRDELRPGYDIVWAAENTDEAELGRELSERALVSTSPWRRPWSSGECVLLLSSLLMLSPAADDCTAEELGREVTDGSVYRKPARRNELSSVAPRLSLTAVRVSVLMSEIVAAEARDIT